MIEGTPDLSYARSAIWNVGSEPERQLLAPFRELDDAGRQEFMRRMGYLLASGIQIQPEHMDQLIDGMNRNEDWRSQRPVHAHRVPTRDVAGGVVYYLRFADRVKIGTTTNLRHRLGVIPHDELLATEPGSYSLEAERHAQFAEHRIRGEWFIYSDDLREHIASL